MALFPATTSEQLAEKYLGVARAIRRRTQRRLEPFGLNPHLSRALRVIGAEGPLRPSTVADRLGIAPRSATDSIAALAAAGLIERRRDPEDGRAQLLQVTTSGAAVLEQVAAIRKEVAEATFGTLTTAEVEDLARLLARLETAGLP